MLLEVPFKLNLQNHFSMEIDDKIFNLIIREECGGQILVPGNFLYKSSETGSESDTSGFYSNSEDILVENYVIGEPIMAGSIQEDIVTKDSYEDG